MKRPCCSSVKKSYEMEEGGCQPVFWMIMIYISDIGITCLQINSLYGWIFDLLHMVINSSKKPDKTVSFLKMHRDHAKKCMKRKHCFGTDTLILKLMACSLDNSILWIWNARIHFIYVNRSYGETWISKVTLS